MTLGYIYIAIAIITLGLIIWVNNLPENEKNTRTV